MNWLRLLLSGVAGLGMTVLAGATAIELGDFIHAPIAAEYFHTAVPHVDFPISLVMLYFTAVGALVFGWLKSPRVERIGLFVLYFVFAAPGHAYAALVLLLSGAPKGVA
ncbi:MAG: hypothetical protein QM817_19535 [Archangium sp.]